MMEPQVEAALQGHEFAAWEATEDNRGYQTTCSKCGGSVYVSERVLYSVLEEECVDRG